MNTFNMNDHLNERELKLNLYSGMHVDLNENMLWVPLWNLSGQMVGYQTYRPLASKNDRSVKPQLMKYFTFTSKVDNKSKLAAFGLDLLSRDNVYGNVCFLTEGVFDSNPFHNLSLNCLGLLGVGNKPNKELLNFLRSLGYTLVAVCEDDKAGKNLRKYADHALFLDGGQDPGDLGTQGVKQFLQNKGFDL